MSRPHLKHPLLTALLASIPALLLQTGCSVITASQKAEVAAFAKVSAQYGTLPGEPIRAYGQAIRFDRLMIVSSRNFESETSRNDAWIHIGKALEMEAGFNSVANQADAALGILDDYSSLLTRLSSDQFTSALDQGTRDLGAALDKGIATYNRTFGKSLSPVGATLAAGIRGAGGIFVRIQQARLLKEAVLAADPMVTALSLDIRRLMESRIKERLTNAQERLGDDFKTAAQRRGSLPLETIQQVAHQLEANQAALRLADSAAKAAEHLAESHRKLAVLVRKRQSLRQRIEDIQSLAEEIKAARKIRSDLSR